MLRILFIVWCGFSLLPGVESSGLAQTISGATNSAVKVFKEFLEHTPLVPKLIYQVKDRSGPATPDSKKGTKWDGDEWRSGLIFARWQPNAMLRRNIDPSEHLADFMADGVIPYPQSDRSNVTNMVWLHVSAKFESEKWGFIGKYLHYSKDEDNPAQSKIINTAVDFARTDEALISSPLCMGLRHLKIGTLKWVNELDFVGESHWGGQIKGQLFVTNDGRPKEIRYLVSNAPDRMFVTKYKYQKQLPPGLPDTFELWVVLVKTGVEVNFEHNRILHLEIGREHLGREAFDPVPYLANINYSLTVWSNNIAYIQDRKTGGMAKVLAPDDSTVLIPSSDKRVYLYLLWITTGVVFFYSLRVKTRQINNNKQKKHPQP